MLKAGPPLRVAICIPTFKRPRLLRALLEGIAAATFEQVERPELRVIVADNDALRTAEEVCCDASWPWPLIYVVEPSRGIARVRNRYLQEAGEADFLVLLDDDEVPDPGWLDRLLAIQQEYGADVVAGPVVPVFDANVPGWARAGFFDRPMHPTGQSIDFCVTGNALIGQHVIGRIGGFDSRFQLCGGEDVQFFKRVRNAGFVIRWCNEAVVRERIAADRANIKWLLRRAYTGGNSFALVEASLDTRVRVRLSRAATGGARVLQGLLSAPFCVFQGPAGVIRALRPLYLGVGMLAGALALKSQSYIRVSGDPGS